MPCVPFAISILGIVPITLKNKQGKVNMALRQPAAGVVSPVSEWYVAE
jgi:hypothetical protein